MKFNLNVFYPPPYEREVWHYELANSDCIQRGIKNVDWEETFLNVNVHKKVLLFNETMLILFAISFLTKQKHVTTGTHPG